MDAERPRLRISWSRLRAHTECHMHASLLAQGKRATSADIRAFFPGTVIDRAMRWWLDQDGPKRGQMVDQVEAILEAELVTAKETGDGQVRWRGPNDRADVVKRLRSAAARLEVVLLQLVVPFDYETAKRFEVPLTIPYLDGTPTLVSLIGEMDLLVRKPGPSYTIWDLKLTQDPSYWRKTVGQLMFYEVAVFLGWKAWPESSGLIIPELDPPYMPFTFTAENRRGLLVSVAKYAEDVWRGDVSLAPKASSCTYCDTKHACPRFAVKGGGRAVIGG